MKSRDVVYDYIIIGTGSGGSVLANKLSLDDTCKVLVLEAGPPDNQLMVHIPAGVYKAYRDPSINWNYSSEFESHLNNRSIDTPRGKVLGGSSSINSMVYMRGHPLDYDNWAKEFKLDDWRFSKCLPYFKAGETYSEGGNVWRGNNGELSVTKNNFQNPLFDAFLEAGITSGQGISDDLNGYNPNGLARLDSTKKNGRRCSAAVAFLRPVIKRSNLTVVTNAEVHKIEFEGVRASAVKYIKDNSIEVARASREILLCGGAINSPKLLLLSGVGPVAQLKRCGITPVLDLPGVGKNLQDHPTIILQYRCKKRFNIHRVGNPINKLTAGLQWFLAHNGVAASNIWEMGGLIKSNTDIKYPNLQYHFGPVGFEFDGPNLQIKQAFALHIDQLRPQSRGEVTLDENNIYGKPLITFNYLSTVQDQKELIDGVTHARALISQPVFDEFRGEEITQGLDESNKSDVLQLLKASTETDYHPSGTCKMENSELGVVDPMMRVHGLEGIRVVDGSIMPKIVSGNLNGPIQMIAARAADYILGNDQLPEETADFEFNKLA